MKNKTVIFTLLNFIKNKKKEKDGDEANALFDQFSCVFIFVSNYFVVDLSFRFCSPCFYFNDTRLGE
nr:hypothetical protein B11C_200027 [Bartonella sp. 1-1C]